MVLSNTRSSLVLILVIVSFQSAILAVNTDRRQSSAASNSNLNNKRSDSGNNSDKSNDFQTDEHQNYLAKVKNKLSTVLQLRKRPKLKSSENFIPGIMKQLYTQVLDYEHVREPDVNPALYTHSANTVRSFTSEEENSEDIHSGKFTLHFKVGSLPPQEKLQAAELCISRESIGLDNATKSMFQILVYDILNVVTKGKRESNFLLLDKKSEWQNSSNTVCLDVKSAVTRWLLTPKDNYGLLIELQGKTELVHEYIRLKRNSHEINKKWLHKQPLLLLYSDDSQLKVNSIEDFSDINRPKRANHRKKNRRKNKKEICQRRSMYVHFSEIGLTDWIVAPLGYDAYYCQGDCPFPLADHLNSTNHAVVQTLFNNVKPGSIPRAACAPTELGSVTVLYIDSEQQPVMKTIEDMVVVSCGCR